MTIREFFNVWLVISVGAALTFVLLRAIPHSPPAGLACNVVTHPIGNPPRDTVWVCWRVVP